jgi:thiol-disulfide isomerase/thioredoxin
MRAARRSLRVRALIPVFLLAIGLPTAATQADDPFASWLSGAEGYTRALEQQRGTSDAILVYFYTDWCPYCRNFNTAIAASSDMQEYLRHAIAVRINPEQGAQEQALARQFQIDGYPTFFVIPAGAAKRQEIAASRTSAAEFIAACKTAGESRSSKRAHASTSSASTVSAAAQSRVAKPARKKAAAQEQLFQAAARNSVHLTNGNVIEGTVREANDTHIVLDLDGVSSLTLSRSEIAAIDGPLPQESLGPDAPR